MNPKELEEFANVLEKTVLKNYDNTLVQLGRMLAINDDLSDRVSSLSDQVEQLTTNNKTLTTRNKSLNQQLARARAERNIAQEDVTRFADVLCRLRQVSPEVSARIDEITTKVNFERNMNK